MSTGRINASPSQAMLPSVAGSEPKAKRRPVTLSGLIRTKYLLGSQSTGATGALGLVDLFAGAEGACSTADDHAPSLLGIVSIGLNNTLLLMAALTSFVPEPCGTAHYDSEPRN